MNKSDAFALGQAGLNGFLFADIGVEANGMPLSVISALARQGLDPWQEAGRLAGLSQGAATEGLARLIAAMPGSAWALPDATVIAARLVRLLPGGEMAGGAAGQLRGQLRGQLPGGLRVPLLVVAVVLLAVLAGVLGRFSGG